MASFNALGTPSRWLITSDEIPFDELSIILRGLVHNAVVKKVDNKCVLELPYTAKGETIKKKLGPINLKVRVTRMNENLSTDEYIQFGQLLSKHGAGGKQHRSKKRKFSDIDRENKENVPPSTSIVVSDFSDSD
nr:TPA_asm: VD1 [Tasmanian devil feces monodnaparvovirus 2]